MKTEEYIQRLTGISKRLIMALSELRAKPPQFEDALFQLASVVDATSKKYYPSEVSTKKRFVKYLRDNETDIFLIASGGKLTIIDSYFVTKDGKSKEFGEILYEIRCSSYHNPEELEKLIFFGNNNQFGHTEDGKFIINESMVQAIFFVLFTDPKNENQIDKTVFGEDQWIAIKDEKHPLLNFLSNRKKLIELIKEGQRKRQPDKS